MALSHAFPWSNPTREEKKAFLFFGVFTAELIWEPADFLVSATAG